MPVDRALDAIEGLMGRVFASAESEAYEVFLEVNLSFSQARMLFMLGISEAPLPISEIAERIRISAASAGRNVDQLVKLGLASRTEDDADRRVKLVALTEKGRQLAWAHHEAKRDAVRSLLQDLSTEECDLIAEALAPLSCQLPKHQKENPNG
ncbi:MAG TPA: MarR family transcriptional regulator [Aeromicrobium sp.]|nr:MarR family transcriptional regulator [Aeromicrobium sp.]